MKRFLMRRILVDYARSRRARKRGGTGLLSPMAVPHRRPTWSSAMGVPSPATLDLHGVR